MTFGGVDTYYDYNERQWKFRRLGGGPVHKAPAAPEPAQSPEAEVHEPPSASQSEPRIRKGGKAAAKHS